MKIDEDKRFKEKSVANKVRLTDAKVESLKPSDRQYLVWDEKQAGLALLVSPGGAKSWRSNWVLDGKAASRKLGRYPELSLAEARKRCLADRAKAQDGEDPRPEKAKAARGLTVGEVAKKYLAEYARENQKTSDQTKLCLETRLDHLWDTPIDEVERSNLQPIVDRLVAEGKRGAAKAAKAWIRALWRWAFALELCKAPTADKIVLKVRESEPRRALTDEELKTIWYSAGDLEPSEGAFLRLLMLMLMLMGLRFSELALAEWSEFRFDTNGRPLMFTVPYGRTKTKLSSRPREYKVPITDQMQPLILELREHAKGERLIYLRHQSFMYRVRKVSGIADFSFHKFRNSIGRVFEEELSLGKYDLGIILNHSVDSGGATGNYMPSQHLRRKRELLDAWNQYVFDLVGIEQPQEGPKLAAVG